MEHETERFWRYLAEKKKSIFGKEEIRGEYDKFAKRWKIKDNFGKVFRNLQVSKIKYMLNKKWLVLTEDQLTGLKQGKFQEDVLFFHFLNEEGIQWYLGIATAKYYNKLTWQGQKVVHILNTKYQLQRKISGAVIKFTKIPRALFLKKSLFYFKIGDYEIPYSDKEKTLLDEIYLKEYKKLKVQIMDYEDLDLENINYYLLAYHKYPLVRVHLVELLNDTQLKKLNLSSVLKID